MVTIERGYRLQTVTQSVTLTPLAGRFPLRGWYIHNLEEYSFHIHRSSLRLRYQMPDLTVPGRVSHQVLYSIHHPCQGLSIPITSQGIFQSFLNSVLPSGESKHCCVDGGMQSFLNFNLLPLYFTASFAARSSGSQINSLRAEQPVLLLVKMLELETGNKPGL